MGDKIGKLSPKRVSRQKREHTNAHPRGRRRVMLLKKYRCDEPRISTALSVCGDYVCDLPYRKRIPKVLTVLCGSVLDALKHAINELRQREHPLEEE